MTQKRVCSTCDSLVKPIAFAHHGPTRYHCSRCGDIEFRGTHPVGKRFGARRGWYIKTWAKNRGKNVLAKVSRRRNR